MSLMKTISDDFSADATPNKNKLQVTFNIKAYPDGSTLPRILENFALRDLVPLHLKSDLIDGNLCICITVFPLKATEAEHLQLRMHNILHVFSVDMQTSD